MFEISPNLVRNDARDHLVSELNDTMTAFMLIRVGLLESYIDSTGLRDDGDGQAIEVTAQNVDQQESILRGQFSWLCPDLEDEKMPVDGLLTTITEWLVAVRQVENGHRDKFIVEPPLGDTHYNKGLVVTSDNANKVYRNICDKYGILFPKLLKTI